MSQPFFFRNPLLLNKQVQLVWQDLFFECVFCSRGFGHLSKTGTVAIVCFRSMFVWPVLVNRLLGDMHQQIALPWYTMVNLNEQPLKFIAVWMKYFRPCPGQFLFVGLSTFEIARLGQGRADAVFIAGGSSRKKSKKTQRNSGHVLELGCPVSPESAGENFPAKSTKSTWLTAFWIGSLEFY